VIDEDWRWRMIAPEKGDFSGIPLNLEGRRAADTWDPAKDDKTGEQCRAYGAPSLMRSPMRMQITWADENTLKIETDYRNQTRLLHFHEAPPAGQRSWQGSSVAEWEVGSGPKRRDRPSGPLDLKVATNNLRSGYLRRNGIPYGQNAELTEYFDLIPKQPNSDEWLLRAPLPGLQLSEMTSLHTPDVVLGTGAHVRCVGKGRKERCTPLTKQAVDTLKRWLREPRRGSGDILFPSARGSRLSADGVEFLLAKHVAGA